MRGVKRLVVAAVLAMAVLPSMAAAKGASEAMLTGGGLDKPIRLEGNGEPGGSAPLGKLAELSGLFAAMFPQGRDALVTERPPGDLGPDFELTYVVPGPAEEAEIRQVVYPYAEGGAVTYTEPGQSFFEVEKTKGGWFQASDELKSLLVSEGLPRSSNKLSNPAPSVPTSWFGWSWAVATLTVAALIGAAALGLRRREARPATR